MAKLPKGRSELMAFRLQTKSRILSAGTLKDRIAAMRIIPSLTNAWKPIARSFPWKEDTIPWFSGTALYPHPFDPKVSLSAPYALPSMPSSAIQNTPVGAGGCRSRAGPDAFRRYRIGGGEVDLSEG